MYMLIMLFIIIWLLSPLALIPICIKRSREVRTLTGFIDELRRRGRISGSEHAARRVAEPAPAPVPAPVPAPAPAPAPEKHTAPARPADSGYGALYGQSPLPEAVAVNTSGEYKTVSADRASAYTAPGSRLAAKPVSKEKKRAAAMSVLMMIGIIFVVLAGLVFSTAVWVNLGKVGRTCAIGGVSALFFGISAFAGRKLKLSRTSHAFYTLGTFFAAITLITAGFLGVTGGYFSVSGEGRYLLYAAAMLIISLLSAKGSKIFDSRSSAYISAFGGGFAAMLTLIQISPADGGFAMLAAMLTAAADIYIFVLRKDIPEKWEKPVITVNILLNALTVLSTAGAFFTRAALFPAAAAVLVIRAIAAAVMGFKGHIIYKKKNAAIASLSIAVLFSLGLIFRLSVTFEVFALGTAVLAAAFIFGMFTLDPKTPEDWQSPVNNTAFVLCAAGVISALCALGGSFGEWDGVCFAIAGVYILFSFLSGFMAMRGHSFHGSAPSAFASMFIGLTFSVMLISELSASTAISALCFTVMMIVIINGVYTSDAKMPRGWSIAFGISSVVLGGISLMTSAYALLTNINCYDGACYAIPLLYLIQSVVITVCACGGHGEYSKTRWTVISQPAGFISTVILAAMALAPTDMFPIAFAALTVVYMLIINTFPKLRTENRNTVLDLFTGTAGVIGALAAVCTEGGAGSVSMGIYIAYAAFVTVTAFKKHPVYSKAVWGAAAQITGILFTAILAGRYLDGCVSFGLAFTVIAVIYMNLVHTFGIKMPEKWELPFRVFSCASGIFGAAFTAILMLINSVWTAGIYAAAVIYITYSAAVTAMAVMGHGEYAKMRWAVSSQLAGIGFLTGIILKLAPSFEMSVLILAAVSFIYSAAAHSGMKKMSEGWIKVTGISEKIFTGGAALLSAALLIDRSGNWSLCCFIISAMYIAYTLIRGIKKENGILRSAECAVSVFAAYNLCCAVCGGDFTGSVFIFVCILTVLAVIHRFVKPVRTMFSDIGLPLAITAACFALGRDILAVPAFGLLAAVILINGLEKDSKLSAVFRLLLPMPVTGMIFEAVWQMTEMINDELYLGAAAAASAAVLGITAAVIGEIKKSHGISFWSFAGTATAMIFMGAVGSEFCGTLWIPLTLLCVSVMLTALFFRTNNNIPSFLTMAGTASLLGVTADIISLGMPDVNVQLITAVIFAAVSLAVSRVFCGSSFIDRKDGKIRIDSICCGALMALPLIHSDNIRTAAFTVLVILAAFVANLARREHNGDFNRAAFTVCSVLTAAALISRPFLIITNGLFAGKINLIIICMAGFAFSKIWKKYPSISENVPAAVYGICFAALITDALINQSLINTLIVLSVSAAILLYSFISKKKRWFAVSSLALTGLTVYMFRDFFAMIDWWIYLLVVGLIFIAVSAANEYFVRKGREIKEKAGRFFEDWSW